MYCTLGDIQLGLLADKTISVREAGWGDFCCPLCDQSVLRIGIKELMDSSQRIRMGEDFRRKKRSLTAAADTVFPPLPSTLSQTLLF